MQDIFLRKLIYFLISSKMSSKNRFCREFRTITRALAIVHRRKIHQLPKKYSILGCGAVGRQKYRDGAIDHEIDLGVAGKIGRIGARLHQ